MADYDLDSAMADMAKVSRTGESHEVRPQHSEPIRRNAADIQANIDKVLKDPSCKAQILEGIKRSLAGESITEIAPVKKSEPAVKEPAETKTEPTTKAANTDFDIDAASQSVMRSGDAYAKANPGLDNAVKGMMKGEDTVVPTGSVSKGASNDCDFDLDAATQSVMRSGDAFEKQNRDAASQIKETFAMGIRGA